MDQSLFMHIINFQFSKEVKDKLETEIYNAWMNYRLI
jgi:hypothetical protein